MRKTKEEADITRQNLLKAALVVFSRQGYSVTRLEDIAEEAGVTRGAIYHHFGGKAELFNTLVGEESAARIAPVLEAAMAEGGTPLQLLRRVLVRTLEYVELDADFRAITELVTLKTEAVPELAEGMQRKIAANRQLRDFVAQTVQQGVDSGEVRAGVEPHSAAITLLAVLNGAIMLWLLDRDLFSLKQQAGAIVDNCLDGLAAP